MNMSKVNTALLGLLITLVGTLGWQGLTDLSAQGRALATYAAQADAMRASQAVSSEAARLEFAALWAHMQSNDAAILQLKLDLAKMSK